MSDPTPRYVEAVGHEPRNLADDHPDVWQWRYRGTKAERELLLELLELELDDASAPQDETLFDT